MNQTPLMDPVKAQLLKEMSATFRTSVPVTAPGPIEESDIETTMKFDDDLGWGLPERSIVELKLVEIAFDLRPAVTTAKGAYEGTVKREDLDPVVKCWREGWSWFASSKANVAPRYVFRLAPTEADLWGSMSRALQEGQLSANLVSGPHALKLFARNRLAIPASQSDAFAANLRRALLAHLNRWL